MDAREARLSRRREREQRNRALESAEEREARLARRIVRDRALRAAQSTAQREALQRRRIPRRVYVRTYVRPRTYMFVRPHMRDHKQHPQTRSGSSHNACISLVILKILFTLVSLALDCQQHYVE